jgi:EAL domain-containing protein (putative c-di-GMP-specific phosphodiesterase class I)
MVKLGQTLGLKTVAEGIEDPDELSALQAHHCDSGQGYLFSKPIDPGQIREFLETKQPQESASPINSVSSPV